MPVRSAQAVWNGRLRDGHGEMEFGSGAFKGGYSFASRFENGTGTNPEELIGAAHAGCFSMALSLALEQAGFTPEKVETDAKVHLEKVGDGFQITKVELSTRVSAPGIDEETFRKQAGAAKEGCPVSRALGGVEITLDASLAK